jgi:hypothetical protein
LACQGRQAPAKDRRTALVPAGPTR